MDVAAVSLPLRVLEITLARIGWEVRVAEIDMIAGRAVVEVHRHDGRWLYLTSDELGRASIERWHRNAVVTRYRGGPQCDGFEDQFLGRDRREGPGSALRSLCNYLADNPSPGFAALSTTDVRRAFVGVMSVRQLTQDQPI